MERVKIAPDSPRAADRLTRNERVPEALDSPRAHYTRDRTYFLRDSELQTLAEVGTFRVIAARHQARAGYGADAESIEREISRLTQQSILAEKATSPWAKTTRLRLFAAYQTGCAACPEIGARARRAGHLSRF